MGHCQEHHPVSGEWGCTSTRPLHSLEKTPLGKESASPAGWESDCELSGRNYQSRKTIPAWVSLDSLLLQCLGIGSQPAALSSAGKGSQEPEEHEGDQLVSVGSLGCRQSSGAIWQIHPPSLTPKQRCSQATKGSSDNRSPSYFYLPSASLSPANGRAMFCPNQFAHAALKPC